MSFNIKLKNVDFSCAPMIVEGFNGKNEVIAYNCNKKGKVIEKFETSGNKEKSSDNKEKSSDNKEKSSGNKEIIFSNKVDSSGNKVDSSGNKVDSSGNKVSIPNCPTGQKYDQKTNKCVCPTGQNYDQKTNKCACPLGSTFNPVTQLCISNVICPIGFTSTPNDSLKNYCVRLVNGICPKGSIFQDNKCIYKT